MINAPLDTIEPAYDAYRGALRGRRSSRTRPPYRRAARGRRKTPLRFRNRNRRPMGHRKIVGFPRPRIRHQRFSKKSTRRYGRPIHPYLLGRGRRKSTRPVRARWKPRSSAQLLNLQARPIRTAPKKPIVATMPKDISLPYKPSKVQRPKKQVQSKKDQPPISNKKQDLSKIPPIGIPSIPVEGQSLFQAKAGKGEKTKKKRMMLIAGMSMLGLTLTGVIIYTIKKRT